MAGSSVDEAGYSPQYPADSSLPNGLQAFISEFYRISDRPEDNERWVGQFTEDARVVIGPGKATGTEGEFVISNSYFYLSAIHLLPRIWRWSGFCFQSFFT